MLKFSPLRLGNAPLTPLLLLVFAVSEPEPPDGLRRGHLPEGDGEADVLAGRHGHGRGDGAAVAGQEEAQSVGHVDVEHGAPGGGREGKG